ncbi:sodium:solute symporter family protein [Salinicoccus halodurans]|uniref:Sodium:pantothenate symporter n=1 Tax=Salinicoccus halodurans TaxID=407035 RepID=A0A0F7HN55_9STAP|nr:sodium:solute symporter family protein [Salinicoccus halodurans]AKG75012.1 sodium:pantothenate symporter [Salinicoccus halodurans]SFK66925.1 solute:Na+ symporter, SSS family/sodium/pantothenate symporter [Salinicoccus halodurans]
MDLAFSGISGILIMLFYGIIMLLIGIITFLRNKKVHSSLDEYYLGGRSLGTLVLFFTFFATQYSGNTVIGYSAEAYRVGYANLVTVPFFIMIVLVYLLYAPRLYKLSRKHNIVTPVDWLQLRFRSKAVSMLGAIIMLYALGNFLLEQLIAIGQGVAGLTGGTVPYQVGVIFFITIMIIYGWLGGMRSVAYTDTMQGIALLVGVFMLLIGTILYFGGLPEAGDYIRAYSPENLGVPEGIGLVTWSNFLILVGFGAAVYPNAIQRIFSAKNERALKKSLTQMAWMPFLTAGVVFVIGILAYTAFPDLSVAESEQVVGMMASVIANENIIFYVAMILLFGGIIAAIVSTADSVLLTFSSIISKDLYGRYINPEASDNKKIMVGKVLGVVAVAFLLVIAWNPPATLYQVFVLKLEILVQVAPAIILGLYWKRSHAKSVFTGMLAGTLLAAFFTFTGLKPLGIFSGIWGLMLNLVVYTVGSFIFGTVSSTESAQDMLEENKVPSAQPVK